ncbi:MAG TPA: hypothetical protein VM262_00255, partial [Acidimicrobiales bacterium]|nr:hypothetical protein [Acidimicrobiales bacterium]
MVQGSTRRRALGVLLAGAAGIAVVGGSWTAHAQDGGLLLGTTTTTQAPSSTTTTEATTTTTTDDRPALLVPSTTSTTEAPTPTARAGLGGHRWSWSSSP